MNGAQHKAMGVSAGIGILAYTILSGSDPTNAICLLTTPFGSLLPDIDHDRSKLGQQRVTAVRTIRIAGISAVIGLSVLSFLEGNIKSVVANFMYLLGLYGIFMLISSNKYISSHLRFITKHRGIMHTLIPPMLLLASTAWIHNVIYVKAILGLVIGYVVHLIGDMGTVAGVPLLYPFSRANIRYMRLHSTKHAGMLQVLCGFWCFLFVALGILFGKMG